MLRTAILMIVLSMLMAAKDTPVATSEWPTDNPILRFSVTKFREIGAFGGQKNFAVEAEITNLGQKKISHATFNFFLFDKNKVRIGQGYIDLANMASGETIKTVINAMTMGSPQTLSVAPQYLPPELAGVAPPKQISMTVYSVPSGAKIKVDGSDAGVTPMALKLLAGSHNLEFSKEGFSNGTFPLVVTPDQLSGGSVTFELGSAAHDTVELRDGTVMTGDLQSVTATDVVLMVGGQPRMFPRNQVKRIVLIERQEVQQ
jgi:hypothetical protein